MSTVALSPLNKDTLAKAVYAVAVAFGVPPERIVGRRRTKGCCDARFALFHLLRERTDATFEAIGEILQRDHGTIMNGDERALDLADTDRRYAARLTAALANFDNPQFVAGELPPIFPHERAERPAPKQTRRPSWPWIP